MLRPALIGLANAMWRYRGSDMTETVLKQKNHHRFNVLETRQKEFCQ
jgi:hypothetical protein